MTAEQSNPNETYEKGLDYLYSDGIDKNPEKARECFEEAASNGSSQALFAIGEMYWWGDLEQDEEKAVSYFKVAAKKGDRNAQHALGFAYQYGRGVILVADCVTFRTDLPCQSIGGELRMFNVFFCIGMKFPNLITHMATS